MNDAERIWEGMILGDGEYRFVNYMININSILYLFIWMEIILKNIGLYIYLNIN